MRGVSAGGADEEVSATTDGRLPGQLAAPHYPGSGCDMHSGWLSYVVAAAIAVIIAIGLWQFGMWGDEHAGDNWANFQETVAKSIRHADERPSRPTPSTKVTHLQTSQP
jgi:hypothetical protein